MMQNTKQRNDNHLARLVLLESLRQSLGVHLPDLHLTLTTPGEN